MVTPNQNAGSKDSEKDGRGKRVPEWLRKTIVQTFLTLSREGKTGRETSATAIIDRIFADHPDIAVDLPTPQSVNNIVKKVRNGLAKDELNRHWSLSLWREAPLDIPREDLPIILKVQRAMTEDIPTRSKKNFKIERLTIREARWVGPIYAILSTLDTQSIDIGHSTMLKLIKFTRSFALREQAGRLINAPEGPADSYDIDLLLSWIDTPEITGETQLRLYQEMDLIPIAPAMPRGVEIGEMEAFINRLTAEEQTEKKDESKGDANIKINDRPLLNILYKIVNAGIPVKMNFGREDWDTDAQVSDSRNNDQVQSAPSEYNVTMELLRPIWQLIKASDDDVLDTDRRAVKVANAFWAKIEQKIQYMYNDMSPKNFETRLKVREVLRS